VKDTGRIASCGRYNKSSPFLQKYGGFHSTKRCDRELGGRDLLTDLRNDNGPKCRRSKPRLVFIIVSSSGLLHHSRVSSGTPVWTGCGLRCQRCVVLLRRRRRPGRTLRSSLRVVDDGSRRSYVLVLVCLSPTLRSHYVSLYQTLLFRPTY